MSNKKKEKLKNIRNKKLRNFSELEIYWDYKIGDDSKCY